MAPLPPVDFVQRPHEFGALKEKLVGAKGNAVAITAALPGAGGYGKTTLAKALAHDLDIGVAYPDGILWVELGEKPQNLLSIVVDLIEILSGERPGLENLNAAAAKLGEALADRRILLIVDDAWREQDLRPFLQGGYNAARLITTRRDDILPIKTARQKVDAMAADEALTLLSWGLPKDQAAAQAVNLAALAQRLGEWALLLKLVNGFLRDRVVKSRQRLDQAIAAVNRRLDERGLTAFDARNEASRSNAIAIAIGASLELLSVDDRARFAELAVFPEDVDIPIGIAARLWARAGMLKEIDSEDLLSRLKNLSLLLSLDLDQYSFRFHDTVRHFLQELAGKEVLARLHKLLLESMKGLEKECADEVLRRYYYLYRLAHLAEAGERKVLQTLLLDPVWLQEKLDALGTPQALVEDFEQFGHTLLHNLVVRALRLITGICIRDKRQLLPQLHGRLLANTAASAFCAAARANVSGPALFTTLPSLTEPGSELLRLETDSWVYALAALPSGRIASSHFCGIRIWNANTGVELARLKCEDMPRQVVALGDGRLAWFAGNKVRLWNAKSNGELKSFDCHCRQLTAIAPLPDGRLALGADDGTIRFWDLSAGSELAKFKCHGDEIVTVLAGLPDDLLVSGSDNGAIWLWNSKSGARLDTFFGSDRGVSNLALLPGGLLASASDEAIVWDINSGRELARLSFKYHYFIAIAALSDGQLAYSVRLYKNCKDKGEESFVVHLWNPKTGAQTKLEGHNNIVNTLAELPDGCLASGSYDETIRVWHPQSAAETAKREKHSGSVNAIALLPGRRVASGSSDKTVRIWDTKTGVEIKRLEGDIGEVLALVTLSDGRLASADGYKKNTIIIRMAVC